MGLLDKIFKRSVENDGENRQERYPLSELGRHVGDVIEVHYINQDIARIETATLRFHPNEDSFCIGDNVGVGYHIIHWDKTYQGKRYAVRLIKDNDGNEIYRNDGIPFVTEEKSA